MKRNFFISIPLAAIMVAILFNSCKKDDTSPPLISLTGGDVVMVKGSSYTEPGYSASDDKDGDLTSSVSVTGKPDASSAAGVYTVYYNVADKAGNSALEGTRKVVVAYNGSQLDKTYNVSESYSNVDTTIYDTFQMTISDNGGFNVLLNNLWNAFTGAATASVDQSKGNALIIPKQKPNFGGPSKYEVEGTGTMKDSANKVVIDLNYTITDTTGVNKKVTAHDHLISL